MSHRCTPRRTKKHPKDNSGGKSEFSSPDHAEDTPLMDKLLKLEGEVDMNQVTPNRATSKADFNKIFSSRSDKRKEGADSSGRKNPFSNFVGDEDEGELVLLEGEPAEPYAMNEEEKGEKSMLERLCSEEEFIVKMEEEEPEAQGMGQSEEEEMESISFGHYSEQGQEEPHSLEVDMEAFEAHYAEMCRQMTEKGGSYQPQYPVFWEQGQASRAGQLFTFTPNPKNSRNLVYDPNIRTCRSMYKCQGCERVFELASALGGHLSRCPFKMKHYEVISKLGLTSAKSRRCRKLEKEGFPDLPIKIEELPDENEEEEDSVQVEFQAIQKMKQRERKHRAMTSEGHRYQTVPHQKPAPQVSPARVKQAPSTPSTQDHRYNLRYSPRHQNSE